MSALKNLPLSKEEIEEEEMRSELRVMGLLEENMDRADMKRLMDFINESKNTSFQSLEISPSEEVELKLTQNNSEILHSQERPLPTFSYITAASTSSDNIETKSPEQFYSKKNFQNEDSESLYDEKANYSCLGGNNSVKNNKPNTRFRDNNNKRLTQSIIKRRQQERWRMNIRKFVEEESEPLPGPETILSDDDDSDDDFLLQYCGKELNPETFERLSQLMSDKLDILEQKFCKDYQDDEGERGPPIKVIESNKNGKKESTVNQNISANKRFSTYDCEPGTSSRFNLERASKRKALHTISQVTTQSINDNSDDDFIDTKKRKFQQEKNIKEDNKNQGSQRNKTSTNIQVDKEFSESDFDNSDLHSIRKSSITKKFIEPQSEYSKRIIPPNPSKRNNKGPRAKKSSTTQLLLNTNKKNQSLNDEEILKSLEDVENELDGNVPNKNTECIDITDDCEVKPNSVQNKLQAGISLLESFHEADVKKVDAEENVKRQKEKEETMRKDERIVQRLYAQEQEELKKIEKERKLNENQKFYNDHFNKQTPKVTKNNYKIPKINHNAGIEEHTIESDGIEEPQITRSNSVEKRSKCPICQKLFLSAEIENHASECDAFCQEPDEINWIHQPSTSRSRIHSDKFKCDICSKYQTFDGHQYEEHVIICKAQNETTSNGIY